MHFASCFGARMGCTVLSGSPLCARCGLVVWISLLSLPNSGAKNHGGDLRSVKTISVFIFSFGVFFVPIYSFHAVQRHARHFLVHSTNSLSLIFEESSISLRTSVITPGFKLSNSLSSVSNNLTTWSGFGS